MEWIPVATHEAEITAYALQRLQTIPGIKIYGDTRPENANQRLGVIPINLPGISHFLVAAILGYEYGIGVRNGCFCAHPYLLHLLGFSETEAEQIRLQMIAGDRRNAPGMVRISFGLYNSTTDVDRLIEALHAIRRGDYIGQYRQNQATGEFLPLGWQQITNTTSPFTRSKGDFHMKPQVFALLAAICWGVGGYFEKKGLHLGNLSPTMGITLRTLIAFILLAAVSFPQWKTLPMAGSKALLYMIIGGGIVAGAVGMLCFYTAIKGAPLSRVMPIAFTSPLFGALMGLIFGGEPFTLKTILGMSLTIGGIILLTIE